MSDYLPAPTPAQLRRVSLRSVRMQRFVEHYLVPVDGKFNGAEAARKAGYEARTANRTAVRLLKIPAVRAAIDAARAEAAAASSYTVEKCMDELGTAMEFAYKTDNASAYVRAVELRGKLSGHLVDRVDARVAIGTYSLNVVGLGAANGD